MPTLEEINVASNCATPICGLSWTILLSSKTTDQVIERIKFAWRIVASLGRTADTELGEWPTLHDFEIRMPYWLASSVFEQRGYDFQAWWSDLEEREWIWWSCSRNKNGTVSIILKAIAMPISDWTLRAVIEMAGGVILARDIEIDDDLLSKPAP